MQKKLDHNAFLLTILDKAKVEKLATIFDEIELEVLSDYYQSRKIIETLLEADKETKQLFNAEMQKHREMLVEISKDPTIDWEYDDIAFMFYVGPDMIIKAYDQINKAPSTST